MERNWKIMEMRFWEMLFIVYLQNKFYLNIIIYDLLIFALLQYK